MNSTSPAPPPPPENGECKLLGPFAVLIQGALGALALLSLVYKRWRERPQRPIKIWAFDVSKQVFGSVLLHLANLFMSMFSAGEIQAQIAAAAAKTVGANPGDDFKPNPCSFYLLNLAIDTTLGIPILILLLKVLTIGISRTPIANPPESIKSGNYGQPPRATWWLKQSIIYFIGLLLMKACVFFIFELCPWLVQVGDWALKWTEGNEALQIAFVMLIFPLIMNAMQYYIIDTFIKNRPADDKGTEETAQHDAEEEGGLLAGQDSRDASLEDEEDSMHKKSDAVSQKVAGGATVEDYDAARDDDTETIGAQSSGASAGSGSTQPQNRSRERSRDR